MRIGKLRPVFSFCTILFIAIWAIWANSLSVRAQEIENCKGLHKLFSDELDHDKNPSYGRTVCADIVALDQALVYNRFGSFNPFGMIYALRRDVVASSDDPKHFTADHCDELLGTEFIAGQLDAGQVRLKDCKRPRPMVLRANSGDILHLRLTNLLRKEAPGISETFCRQEGLNNKDNFRLGSFFHFLRNWVAEGDDPEAEPSKVDHHEVLCGAKTDEEMPGSAPISSTEFPRSRGLNFAIQGLTAFGIKNGAVTEAEFACKGLAAIAPGEAIDCYYKVDREGPYFMASTAAPSGGEGDGGSITHGLFGAVVVQKKATEWYRSQVSKAAFNYVWGEGDAGDKRHAREGQFTDVSNYEKVDSAGVPVLNMLRKVDTDVYELVHADLNAIIYRKEQNNSSGKVTEVNFREFSVFFHDELKTFYTRNFSELGKFGAGQLAGVRDGFAINYGAGGMGPMLLANRKGIGPAANCVECLYEEFFLTSWANGDPALLEQFSDDPSNVHHSYLNDEVVFRNFHAGPKETHVFHLHAHQWFAGNDGNRGSYLDSQTVAPQQGFSYDIYGGGLEVYHKGVNGEKGWHEMLGSGNRNRTLGDSIFHCHLYPHFAQGMWELWRVHDVLEDGTRKLPDGQLEPTLSLAEMSKKVRALSRPGSVDPLGRWVNGEPNSAKSTIGTPIPAVVPLPGSPLPLLPTYSGVASVEEALKTPVNPDTTVKTMPGYPFIIAGKPGHRPPQPPMDIARELKEDQVTKEYLDAGLPRHIMRNDIGTADEAVRSYDFYVPPLPEIGDPGSGDGAVNDAIASLDDAQDNAQLMAREQIQTQVVAKALALGDMTMKLKKAKVDLLPYDGTPIEKAGMRFHHNGDGLHLLTVDGASTEYHAEKGAYNSIGISQKLFPVNGAPPKPGAPFADPCGGPDKHARIIRENGIYTFDNNIIYAVTGPLPAAGPHEKATDLDITNWTAWRRLDMHPEGRPTLYYIKSNGSTEILDASVANEPSAPYAINEEEPFLLGTGQSFTSDPGVVGFRRYEASAVQVNLVTNRAGWHDPQARINVLTANSPRYKVGGAGLKPARVSPKISADENPFFFRALSGECIEFRHTNELPKDLELDDFQVKTPTDTIGQHIHLVKFDVTSSDGSGNGFNYEDGTMAPDEIAARICAAKTAGMSTVAERGPGELAIREFPNLCEKTVTVDKNGTEHVEWVVSKNFDHNIWRYPITRFRDLFQTTVQRWFADPILSPTRLEGDGDGAGTADRTLKTVFSHDHFGPSSIQQHGFYTALVIEPQTSSTCETQTGAACSPIRTNRKLVNATDIDVGTSKIIIDPEGFKLDGKNGADIQYREFALAIADFATLYDPRARAPESTLEKAFPDLNSDGGTASATEIPAKGMATLYCEAKYALVGQWANMAELCGSALAKGEHGFVSAGEGNVPPAWLAAKMPGDRDEHSKPLLADLLLPDEVSKLRDHLVGYRRMAAGYDPADPAAELASPVSPPQRPESISVDHHDPYLLNYRGEPLALRIGEDSSISSDCNLKPLSEWVNALAVTGPGVSQRCTINRQKAGENGDIANVFLSAKHGDPVTPIMESQDGDNVMVRLIQGAQEVQHTFNLDGYNWTRNIDQMFPSDIPPRDDVTPDGTLTRACEVRLLGAGGNLRAAAAGRPDQYKRWMRLGSSYFNAGDEAFWKDIDDQLANCFNAEGRMAAQEIGISEHFEFRAAYRHDSNLESAGYKSRALAENPALTIARLELAKRIIKLAPSDTLQHYGSVDSLWNGAWGLLRVRKPNTPIVPLPYINLLTDTLRKLRNLTPSEEQNFDKREIDRMLQDPPEFTLRRLHIPFDDLKSEAPVRNPEPTVPGLRPLDPGFNLDRFRRRIDFRPVEPGIPIEPAVLQNGAETILPVTKIAERSLSDALRQVDRDIENLPAERERALRDLIRRGAPQRENEPVKGYKLVANCRFEAPFVYTAIVAIEADRVFKAEEMQAGVEGISHSGLLHAPDGLFFAQVDPRYLINPNNPAGVFPADLDDSFNWQNIPFQRVVAAVRKAYKQPEPLVISVNAGDCVKVTVLNALKKTDTGGVTDGLGDAAMPGIVSLNVEPNWNGPEPRYTPAAGGQTEPNVAEKWQQQDWRNVAPSSRLAITIPLPVMNHQHSVAKPIGRNPVRALSGINASLASPKLSMDLLGPEANSDRSVQIEQFEFYAGRAVARTEYTWQISIVTPSQVFHLAEIAKILPQEILNAVPIIPASAQNPLPQPLPSGVTYGLLLDNMGGRAKSFLDKVQNLVTEFRIPMRVMPPVGPDLPALPQKYADEIRNAIKDIPIYVPGMIFDGDEYRLQVRIDGFDFPVDIGDAVRLLVARDTIEKDVAGSFAEALRSLQGSFTEFLVTESAKPYIITLGELVASLKVHYIPYAFGALPLKSHGDVIGHAVEGLIGAINIIPEESKFSQVRGPKILFGSRLPRPNCFQPNSYTFEVPLDTDNPLHILPGRTSKPVPNFCRNYVIVPVKPQGQLPVWNSTFFMSWPDDKPHRVRQFTLFWQDGLNLQEAGKVISPAIQDLFDGLLLDPHLLSNCGICDDSYDFGEKGVSYRSEPFHVRLRGEPGGAAHLESQFDLNAFDFGTKFFPLKPSEMPVGEALPMPVLRARAGEEIVIHVVHPGGRARQRAFVTIAQDYNDLFPDFGFPHSALLAPGKAITASLTKPVKAGCYLWFDGPTQLRAGGAWGLLDVVAPADFKNPEVSSCTR